MVNGIILSLANAGILNITSDTFPINEEGNKAAYRIYKFKRQIANALKELQEGEKALFNECGIEDPAAFNKEMETLAKVEEPTTEQLEKGKEMKDKASKYNNFANQLYNEDVDIKATPMSWSMWRRLLAENKERDIHLAAFENELEGILWSAPEEEE